METNKPSKEWFISEYESIHENLKFLEREIEKASQNKISLAQYPNLLQDLKKSTEIEIERLNKTREYERQVFNY